MPVGQLGFFMVVILALHAVAAPLPEGVDSRPGPERLALADGEAVSPRSAGLGGPLGSDRQDTSSVGTFTPSARFSNRAAANPALLPSATGHLEAGRTRGHQPPPYRPIELSAGYTVVPDGPAPTFPSGLAPMSSAPAEGRLGYLVEFAEESTDARQRIEQTGGSIVAALSGGAYLVRLDGSERSALAAEPGSPWIGAWEPAYKLSADLDRAAETAVECTALLFPDADADACASALRALGAAGAVAHDNGINKLVRFSLPGRQLAGAAGLADILWIEPKPRYTLLNENAQWVVQTDEPRSRRVWDHGLRGQGQVIMSSDSGIRTNHEMFDDPAVILDGFGDYPTHRKIIAYKPGSDAPGVAFGDEASSDFHGTHTAGTTAGNSDPTRSGRFDGMAKDAKLYFMDLAGPANRGVVLPPDDLNDLFLPSYVGNSGGAARISTNSWGAPVNGAYTVDAMAVDQFTWNHPDYLICFANGNSGAPGTVQSPAAAKNCLSVGGTGNGDYRTKIYLATSRGPTRDLRRKPTICAPGDSVISSVGNTRYAYANYSGTSMATPTAAGAMALARQYLTDGWYPTGTPVPANGFVPSAALLKAMAVNSGENDMPPFFVPDNNVGWGRLNLDNVLYFPGDARRTLLVDGAEGLLDNEYVEYEIQVTDPGQPLSITLCWTDAPGNPAAAVQIVDDLDLVVRHGGVTYLGNRMFNGVSLTGGARDSINVEEGVRVPTPGAGLWTVRIEGRRVPLGPQPYALCITGGVGQGAGTVALDRYTYALTDTVDIEVLDTDASGTILVTVTSPTEPGGENVTITGADGVYRARLAIGPVLPDAADHRLAVAAGDNVRVSYADASPPLTVTATASVAGATCLIGDVRALPLGPTSALVTWTTDVASTSRVRFGADPGLTLTAESTDFTRSHRVLLRGLRPGVTYNYDVESTLRTGTTTRDDFGGMHRVFTTRPRSQLALVFNGSSGKLLDTWLNALDALGWSVDVYTGADADPPLVGDASAGLSSYAAVFWQVDPDTHPPLSDAQRAAVDSLLDRGGRLLITGHDLGFGLSDAAAPAYSPEREAWLESTLKTRYYQDVFGPNLHLYGAPGDPVSGGFTSGIPYSEVRLYATSDRVGPAPSSEGTAVVNWLDDIKPQGVVGLRWESPGPKGKPGASFWGGQSSRLQTMYFEWAAFGGPSSAHSPLRTAALEQVTEWLLGHRPPRPAITSPAPGEIVTTDAVRITYSVTPDSGRVVTDRSLYFSRDGGQSWSPVAMPSGADSVTVWDLAGGAGGSEVPNSQNVLLRLLVHDDGSPALAGQTILGGAFTLARPDGDIQGPVAMAGSVRTLPTPVHAGSPASVVATFTDAGLGDSPLAAAEYSWGSGPASPGAGVPMSLPPDSTTAFADLGSDLAPGKRTLWVRARDASGNWGPAGSLGVTVAGPGGEDGGDGDFRNFLGQAVPNPTHGSSTIRFGLAEPGTVRLHIFDLQGRRVRTLVDDVLDPGEYSVSWDGRNESGLAAAAGIYFLQLSGPAGTYRAKLVRVN